MKTEAVNENDPAWRVIVNVIGFFRSQSEKEQRDSVLHCEKTDDEVAGENHEQLQDPSSLFEKYGSTIMSEVRIAILDLSFRFIWVNEKFCEHFNYSATELKGRLISSLKCLNHDHTFFQKVFKSVSNGNSWSGEISISKSDGRSSWIKTTIIPVRKDGVISSFVVFNSDITRTKTALEEKNVAIEKLILSEARYRAVVENQPDLICLCNANGDILYGNGSFCSFAGKHVTQIMGANIRDFFFQGVKDDYMKMIFALSPVFPEISGVFELQDHLKTKLWYSLSAKALFDAEGNVVEILLIGRDVSEIKNGEIKKQLYAQDLERIAFITSHNVRGPIATMLGLLELLKMNAINTCEWEETLINFRLCVENLDHCTRELSAFVSDRQSSGTI
jgi:PAS domain S-box-containing protein